MTLSALGIFSAAGAGGEVVAGDYELIESSIISGSSTSSITFSNLGDYSSTYKHLQIRWVARGTNAATLVGLYLRYNNDSGSNYSFQEYTGRQTLTGARTALASQTSAYLGDMTGASESSNIFSAQMLNILDPYSTTKTKASQGFWGVSSSSVRRVGLSTQAWYSTSSVTSIMLFPSTAFFAADSRFSLYGIRG
jgi:hypothetical protein